MKRNRLDAELVRRGLVSSRTDAKRAIEDGKVAVRGVPVQRASTLVGTGDPVTLIEPGIAFASRGGVKLDGALRDLDVTVSGRHWLDAGASTGGFTDRLLRGGAVSVIAIDVGYGQLAWELRNDDRVIVMERTNVRDLTPGDLPYAPDAVTGDLSFISLGLVLPALAAVSDPEADFVLLVKPQFEVGRGSVGKGGVVRDPELWRDAMAGVAAAGNGLGLSVLGACVSDLKGPAGNTEFFLHLKRGHDSDMAAIDRALQKASA